MPKSEKKLKKPHFIGFSLIFSCFLRENLVVKVPPFTWKNSKSLRNKFEKIERNSIFERKSAIFHHFLDKIELKFIENQSKSIKILINSCTTPWLKLRENQLKLIITSLKINENLAQNWEKISYFPTKFSPNHSKHLISTYRRVHILLPLLLAHD